MSVDKSKIELAVPIYSPDKILDTIEGQFTTTNSASSGFGATYDGEFSVNNPTGKLVFPVTVYDFLSDITYFTDFEQGQSVVVVSAASTSSITYRWAANSYPFTIRYKTILIAAD